LQKSKSVNFINKNARIIAKCIFNKNSNNKGHKLMNIISVNAQNVN